MNRRDFLASGAGGALGAALTADTGPASAMSSEPPNRPVGAPSPEALSGAAARANNAVAPGLPGSIRAGAQATRAQFARLDDEVFLNAAGGTPLGSFGEIGLREYEDFWRLGPGAGRAEAVGEMLDDTKARIATLIGAQPAEVAFVQCTKQGEQVVLEGLPALRAGGNVVTNDLHFAGSLHNLVGMRAAGLDVRIVRSAQWQTSVEGMAEAIDDDTALVSVTLVSNVNGHVEPMREIADIAHAHGAHVYADIIQAVGIAPVDVRAMGIDFAAGNGYKWMFGPHGTGFLYVREELQGGVLQDRMFPGHTRHNYEPWSDPPDPTRPDFPIAPRADAQRYQPGHSAYLCYAALHAGLEFLDRVGVPEALAHTVRLNQRLVEGLDAGRYECISPHLDRAPIVSFQAATGIDVESALRRANVVVSLSPDGRIRVSPAVYSNEADIDRLVDALNGA